MNCQDLNGTKILKFTIGAKVTKMCNMVKNLNAFNENLRWIFVLTTFRGVKKIYFYHFYIDLYLLASTLKQTLYFIQKQRKQMQLNYSWVLSMRRTHFVGFLFPSPKHNWVLIILTKFVLNNCCTLLGAFIYAYIFNLTSVTKLR